MGGGGAMRAAAKVAGLGVVNGGLRGVPAVSPAEHPLTSAARQAARPVSAIVSSSDDVKSNVLNATVQRPVWEIDDWEFAGGEEELIRQSGEPMPRLVFGGVPTLQETKEATSELSHAVDKIFLSKSTGGEDSFHSSGLSLLSNSEYLETKACVTSETTRPPMVPKSALQAFRFLNESPAAQSVVASIACDQNVWDAVLQNPELVKFLHSQKTDINSTVNKLNADAEVQYEDCESFDDSSKSGHPGESGNGFLDLLQDVKLTVVEMMSSLSDYFQSFFGGSSAEKVSPTADGSARSTFADKTLGASFVGLAVMVIMVVVMKRG